jgi:hypothetical protein
MPGLLLFLFYCWRGGPSGKPSDTLFLKGLTSGELRDPTRSGKRVYLRSTLKDVVDGCAPPLS